MSKHQPDVTADKITMGQLIGLYRVYDDSVIAYRVVVAPSIAQRSEQ